MKRLALAGLVMATVVFAGVASAHESRPAYLQLTLEEAGLVRVLLKVPALGDRRLALYPNLPADCEQVNEPSAFLVDNAYTERSAYRCERSLFGRAVAIDGLASTLTDVLVRVQRADGSTQVARLTPSSPSFQVEAVPGNLSLAITYMMIGIEHILLGIDHLFFVLALLLVARELRTLVWTITAFTVAHSLTLAAATLGFLDWPQDPVEVVIALSIVFMAGEIARNKGERSGIAWRRTWSVTFAFGLLHGLGFAGALSEIGLPENAVPLALLFFNVGVELGQLAFILVVFAVIHVLRPWAPLRPEAARTAIAYGIGTMASFWTIQRVVGFWY